MKRRQCFGFKRRTLLPGLGLVAVLGTPAALAQAPGVDEEGDDTAAAPIEE